MGNNMVKEHTPGASIATGVAACLEALIHQSLLLQMEKSMKENRKKSYAGIKGDNSRYIENYIDSLVNSWLPEELNKNLLAGVLVLLPDYPNNNWLTA